MARLAEKLFIGVLFLVSAAYAVVPEDVSFLLSPVTARLLDGIVWAGETLPRPVFIGLVFLLTTVVSILVALSFGRVLYAVLRHAGPRTRYLYRKILPSTPIGKVAVAFMLTIGFMIGSVWALPYVLGELGGYGEEQIQNSSDRAFDTDRLLKGIDEDALQVTDGDVIGRGGYDGPAYERPTPDADGDRLKDRWEANGETERGVALPNADPERKDLYVQVNYGGGTQPLSDREKRQLREVWADMPVENPDGTEGITIHIVDSRPKGGALGTNAVFDGTDNDEVTRYYTSQHLGNRMCRYHQVVVGEIENDNVGGRASAPGYALYVDTERSQEYVKLRKKRDFDRKVSLRVHIITHELLHNVAGRVGGDVHTNEGWLSPKAYPWETYLSNETAEKLNEDGLAGSGYYQHQLCGGPSG